MSELIGYLNRWSARAGETLTLYAHSDRPASVTADIVSLTRFSDAYLRGPSVAEAAVTFDASAQTTHIGSYARLPLGVVAPEAALTVALLVKPTTAYPGDIATLATGRVPAITLRWTGDGRVAAIDASGVTLAEVPLAMQRWSCVAVVRRATTWTLCVQSHGREPRKHVAVDAVLTGGARPMDSLWLAASPSATGAMGAYFDGMIEAPAQFGTALEADQLRAAYDSPRQCTAMDTVLAAWDFSRETTTDRLVDTGPFARHGRVYHGPTRLVPGAYWTPGVLDPMRAPHEFGAVHFHRDDLRDAGWTESAQITLPSQLTSGVYGARLRNVQADTIDVIPFWVRAASPATAKPLAFLAPTYTYLAYGNAPSAMLGPPYWGADHASEHQRKAHREFGPSLYSRHPDHTGVSMVSRHRPILTVRPGVRPWGFEADRLLTDWMDRQRFAFDVLTDEDIDADGISALTPHRVLVTGNHPEYWSARMLDTLDVWLHRGGRLVYAGGNGFYWRISSLASLPGVIECRRPEGGTRPWIAEPGRGYHQLDGEAAGLWRRLGRPPQQLVGVGFAGQGFARSTAYRINPSARTGWASFALRDVPGDVLGASGHFGGGAAGQEIDRYDERLGSSPNAVVLATSQGQHDAATLRTVEELLSHEPYAADPKVRADLTITPIDGGGAVLATGSMAWVGALDDAGVSQVMTNVLTRFLQPEPIGPSGGAD